MKNSHLISEPAAYAALASFANGCESGRGSSAWIAWSLEDRALREGWPEGRFFGVESELIAHFGTSRETLREAISMLEAHGSMRMRRGRHGGLQLVSPAMEQAASTLATYLRAVGCTNDELIETAQVAEPLLNELHDDEPCALLFKTTLAFLLSDREKNSCDNNYRDNKSQRHIRAPGIAFDIVRSALPIPAIGVALGSEAELCIKFNSCRSILRQALRILDDLEMLQVRYGRGGGYMLKPPSPVGMIRHLFALFASRRQVLPDTNRAISMLNLISLRLAMRRLEKFDGDMKMQCCDSLSAHLAHAAEPRRWGELQRALSTIADSKIVNTLQYAMVAYQVRLARPQAKSKQLDNELKIIEQDLVTSLRRGQYDKAERLQRIAQARLSEMLENIAR
ncbi:MAG: GntR family transcriptional regulator [Spongiibacteraceae bacterium]